MQAYKGFDQNLKCRDFQYEIGKTYTHEGNVKVCDSGFHACEHPLHVFRYYAPNKSRFCLVEVSGVVKKEDDKVCSSEIKIVREVTIREMIEEATKIARSKEGALKEHATGWNGAASATGLRGAASATGASGAASATGESGAAMASGEDGRVLGEIGCAIFSVYRKDGKIMHAVAAIVGKNGIKPNVFYQVNSQGKFVEAE